MSVFSFNKIMSHCDDATLFLWPTSFMHESEARLERLIALYHKVIECSINMACDLVFAGHLLPARA